jgi:outer membrane protein
MVVARFNSLGLCALKVLLILGEKKTMIARRTHVALAILTIASLITSPVFTQAQEPTQQAQAQAQTPATTPVIPMPARTLSLGPDYSKGPRFFPNVIAPYESINVPAPILTNAPRLDQLIQDGKLMLSLDDAISIALENNLDIYVQRFTPWIAETQLLKAKAGGVPQSGSSQNVILGSGPTGSFDPVITSNLNWARSSQPVNNPFTSGAGTTTVPAFTSYSANVNFGYSQLFHTGTGVSVNFTNNRSSTTLNDVVFNPAVQSTLTFTITQPLLNGFGILPNTRFILEAKNTVKVAESQFEQQVITSATSVSNAYWELVFDRENVKVQQAAVGVSQKLYEDNKKQLEIGTMAPLDVLTAESELATDTQNLILAQTTKLQQETVLLNLITKNLVSPDVLNVEVIPTTGIATPDVTENIALTDAVQEAWQKRPEILQAQLNVKNSGIEVKATRNALLPTANLFGQYSATGLNGDQITTTQTATGTFTANSLAPLVDQNGNIINVGGVPVFAGIPNLNAPVTTIQKGGLPDALSAMINSNFPTYAFGINFTLPIRNRSAQADNARALLDERQIEVQYRSLQNSIVLNVRNAQIALQQDRAQVAAAEKAQTLAAQTLDAEQKKYQLGSSTSYNVVLRARDLTTAQGNLLRARVNLEEAAVNFNQAMGRTLEVNHILVSDAIRGKVARQPLIPGAPEAAVPGNQ